MKLNETIYAIVKPDNEVCGDGECSCLYSTREQADEELDRSSVYLCRMNSCDDLRVVAVKLVEEKE